jgi:beta-carotene 3-hydroxylase
MIRSILLAAAAFILMEFVAYAAHRYVYHGFLWVLHRSHHTPRKGPFELNDFFPLFFAIATMAIIFYGLSDPLRSDVVAVGGGVTLYGMVYFFVHDLYIHRRLRSLPLRMPILLALKKAHAIHHRTGGEPFGLLFFLRRGSLRREGVQEDDAV